VRALAQRLALAPVTLLGVTLVTFALVHLAPGDPALLRAGEGRGVTAQVVAEDRALAGLDRPPAARYLAWLGRSAALDFGRSLGDGRLVRARIAEALPRTAALGLLAALFAFGLGIATGAWAAAREQPGDGSGGARRGSGSDAPVGWPSAPRLFEAALAAGYGVPVVAIALVALRAGAPFGDASPAGLVAPALCLAWPSAIVLAGQQRSALRAALRADYLRTARAKGASRARALGGHALRNALLPMVALFGTQLPVLLSGSVIVERVFGLHGLGLLGYEAVLGRDYPLLMGLCTLGAAITVGGTLLADAAALLVDPRLRRAPEPRGRA
jgi:peptide/nickel transport system permease protein